MATAMAATGTAATGTAIPGGGRDPRRDALPIGPSRGKPPKRRNSQRGRRASGRRISARSPSSRSAKSARSGGERNATPSCCETEVKEHRTSRRDMLVGMPHVPSTQPVVSAKAAARSSSFDSCFAREGAGCLLALTRRAASSMTAASLRSSRRKIGLLSTARSPPCSLCEAPHPGCYQVRVGMRHVWVDKRQRGPASDNRNCESTPGKQECFLGMSCIRTKLQLLWNDTDIHSCEASRRVCCPVSASSHCHCLGRRSPGCLHGRPDSD